ncbi:PRC-barrel domain-containing protein [Methanocaldococcus fervens]|uniref:PRC-barrel domain protein n=1 Tax=Methanocaldococcus fervens (strain DSM 4213 / JCM 15782 / AG86) TaxID=573064 RepID=C7P6F4_METFA|nr:PRC-barrel domain-containing protein [Methanocaldococcus fervens]ACV24136.1 PRC-barrel domain protein [Methanocaldococcus fervens AG86]
MEKMPARLLFERNVVGNMGSILGKVKDVIFDERIGRLVSLEVEPTENSPIEEGKNVLIPYRIVTAIKDVVVVDEKSLNKVNIRPSQSI